MTHSLAKKVWFKMVNTLRHLFCCSVPFSLFGETTKEDSNFLNGCAIKVCVKGLEATIFFLAWYKMLLSQLFTEVSRETNE